MPITISPSVCGIWRLSSGANKLSASKLRYYVIRTAAGRKQGINTPPQYPSKHETLFQCWASVGDAGPTLKQRWVIAYCWWDVVHITITLIFAPLDTKGCTCHFTKWHIHHFVSKGTIFITSGPRSDQIYAAIKADVLIRVSVYVHINNLADCLIKPAAYLIYWSRT